VLMKKKSYLLCFSWMSYQRIVGKLRMLLRLLGWAAPLTLRWAPLLYRIVEHGDNRFDSQRRSCDYECGSRLIPGQRMTMCLSYHLLVVKPAVTDGTELVMCRGAGLGELQAFGR